MLNLSNAPLKCVGLMFEYMLRTSLGLLRKSLGMLSIEFKCFGERFKQVADTSFNMLNSLGMLNKS